MPVENGETALALPKEEGGYADDPILGVVANLDLGPLQGAAEVYVGVLAATILFIATNAGMIGVSRLTYSMGQHRQLPEQLRASTLCTARLRRDRRVRAGGLPHHPPRAGRLPRHDLRLRRHALVHDRASRGHRAAPQAARA